MKPDLRILPVKQIKTDYDDDDSNDLHMKKQSMSTSVLLGMDVSKLSAARESSCRFGNYVVLEVHPSGNEFAQLGSCARTARGEVLNRPPSRCPNTPNVNECRYACMGIHIWHILIHVFLYRSTYRRMHTSLCGSSDL